MRRLGLLALALSGAGCFTAGYLGQAAGGELAILSAARPLAEVQADPATSPRVKALLARVPAIEAYGRRQGLRRTPGFGRYAELDRPAAAWLVLACAPLAFEARHWAFPVVGSVPYLGFFDEGEARAEAARLASREGLDVAVRPARAYSTLGWFPDPILSSMLPAGDEALGELANTVLHESVHATVYLADQSTFNESLAAFVADRLTLPWLTGTLGPAAPEVAAWRASEEQAAARTARYLAAYRALDALYRSGAPDEAKRSRKALLLGSLQADLHLAATPSNATLIGLRTYGAGLAGFERLLSACGGRWPRLLAAVATLRPEDFGRPQREDFEPLLDRLAGTGCQATLSANLLPSLGEPSRR